MSACGACGAETAEPVCEACGREVGHDWMPLPERVTDLEYDFADVTPAERVEATDLLIESGVPYRWDPGFVLRVPVDAEEHVDTLFGHDDALEARDQLVLAVDVLIDMPDDEGAIADLADATGGFTIAAVPESCNPVRWAFVALLARELLGVVDTGAAEDVVAGAEVLRAVLDLGI